MTDAPFVRFEMHMAGTPGRYGSPYSPSLGDALYQAAQLVWSDPESAEDVFEFHREDGELIMRCEGRDLQRFHELCAESQVAPGGRGHGGG